MQPKTKNVAIVDDDPGVRRGLGRLVASFGLGVTVFGSGEDFLDQLEEIVPDYILLDYQLPGASGLEVLSLLLVRHPFSEVHIITAADDLGLEQLCRAAGASGFIHKPVRYDDLKAIFAIGET